MKKLVAGLILALSLSAPAHAQPQPINKQLEALPAAARGVAYVAAVTSVTEHCQPGSPVIRALKISMGTLAAYAEQAATRAELVNAIRIGIKTGSIVESAPGFTCSTYGPVVHADQLPALVVAEMKRAPDPRGFNLDNIKLPPRPTGNSPEKALRR